MVCHEEHLNILAVKLAGAGARTDHVQVPALHLENVDDCADLWSQGSEEQEVVKIG